MIAVYRTLFSLVNLCYHFTMFDILKRRRQQRFTNQFKRGSISRIEVINYIVTGGFIALIVGILLFGLLFAWYAKDLPHPDKIKRVEGLSTIIYDRSGEVLYDIYRDQNRIPVPFEEIPKTLKDATLSIEDKDFYKHEGFSTIGMLRAMTRIFFRGKLEGGSTLTQQLVKNVLLTQERTLPRKLKEFILSVQIERKYTKDEILQMYFNETPYGSTTYGVEAAAQYYFDKHVRQLTAIECVVLAGIPQSPSLYSPFGDDPKAYIWRSEQVLRRMREDGKISKEEEKKYKEQLAGVVFSTSGESFSAGHFIEYVRQELIDKFGQKTVEGSGLRVTTTLDSKLQKAAEVIVKEEVDKLKNLKVSNGAAIVLNPQNGEILAMIGSKDYEASEGAGYKFNVVTQGLRQPGSALKPITYATAFKKGYTPSSLIMDVETHFPGGSGEKDYVPKNYDGKFRGPVQMRFALANSINVPAVKTVALTGVRDMLQTAFDMGLTTLEPTKDNINRFGLSVTLGGGEVKLIDLAQSFGVFTTGGIRHEPVSLLKVTDQKGKVLYEQKETKGKRVLGEDISYLVTHILSDNEARREIFGERSYLIIPGRTVAVKTGTTDDKRDNWTIGGSTDRVVGVWVGNNDNSPMHPSLASGVTGAAPIWNRIIKESVKGTTDKPFPKPGNIVELEIDAYGGGLPREGSPKRKEVFIKGTEPTNEASIYQKLKVAKSDGKLANAVQIASGDFEEKDFIVLKENDPISSDGKNRWQEGIDGWLATQSDGKFHPPTEISGGKSDEVIVNIKDPQNGKRYDDHDVKITVEAFSLGTIKNLIVYIDNKEKKIFTTSSFSETFNLDTGVYEIKVRGEDDRGKSAEGTVTIGVLKDVK